MALKAGYKGIKKAVLDTLLPLIDIVKIKSLGDGLSLSEEGELEMDVPVESLGDGLSLSEEGELEMDVPIESLGAGFSLDEGIINYSGSSVTVESIFHSDVATGSTFELSKEITDYDFVVFIAVDGDYSVSTISYIKDKITPGSSKIPGIIWSAQFQWLTIGNDSKTMTKDVSVTLNIRDAYGIKIS